MKQSNCTLSNTVCSADKLNKQVIDQQNQLIGLIGNNRNVPCFIRAPRASGAEELVESYLQTLNADVDVSYAGICDDGEIFQTSQTSVVVVPDLQWLDGLAAKQFSAAVDKLLDLGKQVIIVCKPQNDRYENLQSDRLLIDGNMLLQHFWLQSDDYSKSIAAFLEDFLPLEIRLLATLTVILGETDLDQLGLLGYKFNPDLPELLCDLHPLFNYQRSNACISVSKIQMPDIALEICRVIAEYLEIGQNSALEPECVERLTKLSIYLLEKDDLKRSHQVLTVIERLIANFESKSANRQSDSSVDSRLNPKMSVRQTNKPSRLMSLGLEKSSELYIKLFGEMEVYLNGKVIENEHLRRNKIRKMLFYLATSHNKGASREALLDYLWPYLDYEHALRNLYTSWSLLGKGLGADNPKGCPFIERRGHLYKLNFKIVSCDTLLFEELSNQVLFGNDSLQQLVENVRQMELLYRNELITNTVYDNYQKGCLARLRSLMVDSMMVAIRALKKDDQQTQALYFARAAHEIDTSREDVYRELMDAQSEAGQRTSAMQTYFSCKRYLSEELGILPSKKTTALYQELLMDSG